MTALRATNIADIISVLPIMLGADPEERMVMTIIKDHAIFGCMATDMPDNGDQAIRTLEAFVQRAKRVGADIAFLTIHTEDEDHEEAYAMFALGFGVKCEAEGIEVPSMALITGNYWRDYSDPEVKRDLSELEHTRLAASMVAEGVNLKPTVTTIPEGDRASMSLTLKALNFRATLPKIDFRDLDQRQARMLRDAWDLWTSAISTNGDMSEREAADLIGYFQHPTFRDMFIAYIIADDFTPETYEATFKLIMEDPKAEWLPRARQIVTTLRELMRWTEQDQRLNMLATAGFCEWFMGRGTQASAYYEEALSIDSDHRMTNLMMEVARRMGLSKAIVLPDAPLYADAINE